MEQEIHQPASEAIPPTLNQPESPQINSELPVGQNQVNDKLAEARDKERHKINREEKLRQENEQLRAQFQELDKARLGIIQNGWDLNALLNNKNSQISHQQNAPIIDELQNQILKLKEEMSSRDIREANKNELAEIIDFVKQNDDYELVRAFKLEGEVQSLIKTHYDRTKKILSFSEAATQIEKHLEKVEAEHAETLRKTKKAKAFFKDFDVTDVKVEKSQGVTEKEVKKAIDESIKEVKKSKPDSPRVFEHKKKLNHHDLIKQIANKYK